MRGMERTQRVALLLGPTSRRAVSGGDRAPGLEQRRFGHSLILGEHRPREAVAGGAVDQPQGLLVLVVWVDIHCQHRPEDLLKVRPQGQPPSGPAPWGLPGCLRRPLPLFSVPGPWALGLGPHLCPCEKNQARPPTRPSWEPPLLICEMGLMYPPHLGHVPAATTPVSL